MGFTDLFTSISQREILPRETLQKRLLLCLYGLGTNTGLKHLANADLGTTYQDLRNETGQHLTLHLQLKQTLQVAADKIRDAALADIVLLYPYDQAHQRFIAPPQVAGTLYDSYPEFMSPERPNDVVALALLQKEPLFARQSADIYTKLADDVRMRQENFQLREKIRSTVVIPLQAGDEKVGVLFVNFRQPQRFDATQKLFIEGLTHYAAIAIKNAQAFGSLSYRRIHELEVLQNIDRELNRILDLNAVLATLLKLAKEQVDSDGTTILLYNPRTQMLEPAMAIGRHTKSGYTQKFPLHEEKGITHWVLQQKKPARIRDVHHDPQWKDLYVQTAIDTVSELDVPLLDGKEMVGVLNFESSKPDAFNDENEHFLVTLAGHAVLAIKKAQAYEREKRLAEEGQVLNQISRQITSQLNYVSMNFRRVCVRNWLYLCSLVLNCAVFLISRVPFLINLRSMINA